MLILIITTITLYLKSRVIFVCTAKELCCGDFKSNYIKLNPINPMVLKKERTSTIFVVYCLKKGPFL